ncbi:hypothetical protein HU200_046465 [Digitaria exilis]|uniref:Glucose-6-phosphate isomerase n=1 Tax=Digitaria exilis TaxID=1010633 RepID=A0A835ECH9_9POAL|nr:hypothetical protein HU200_046465 [Digitaria exilis]
MASISGTAAPPSSRACRLRLRRHLLLRPSHLASARPTPSPTSPATQTPSPPPTPPRPRPQPLGPGAENGGGRSRVSRGPDQAVGALRRVAVPAQGARHLVDVEPDGVHRGVPAADGARMQRAFSPPAGPREGRHRQPDEGAWWGTTGSRDPAHAPNSFPPQQRSRPRSTASSPSPKTSSPEGRLQISVSICLTSCNCFCLQRIGGSALGLNLSSEALAPDNPPLKSGGTPETRNGLLEVQKAFRDAVWNSRNRFLPQGVAITQEKSLLDNTARIEGWLARFPMFDWVGGRTSEMSAVGLLPAALQGIDIKEMLVGAALMDEETRNTVVKENPAALLALCWYWASEGIGNKDMVVLPYKDSLLLLSRYLQQLVMESLGKEFDLDGNRVNQGLTVYGNKGSTDQHASALNFEETKLFDCYRDNRGVEAGKKAAGEVLALQKRVLTILNEATYGISDLCFGYYFSMKQLIEMIYKIIQHMAANDRAIIAEGSCGSPRSVKVYLGECNVDEDMQAA